jgi:hypothetical protein
MHWTWSPARTGGGAGFASSFERVVDEAIELDVFQVGAGLAANKVEILAIALNAIAEA